MARYGILSDIHGNLEALQAALAFLDERGVERVLCLGDLVGYNADSDACLRALERLPVEAVAGNHDLIASGALGTERCCDKAAFALRRTRRALSEPGRRALLALPRRRVIEGDVVLVHGSVLDVCQYMNGAARVEQNEALLRRLHPGARVCFFGHTHAPRLYDVRGGVASAREPGEETLLLPGGDRTFFVNPGSVDAARKEGERRAELAIFDSSRRSISFHRVLYDHERSERRAIEGGYRMTRADEGLYTAARALRRGRRLLGEGLRRAARLGR